MKKALTLTFALSASAVLSSCALSKYLDPGKSEDYFTVNLYTDYDGIIGDYANKTLDIVKAKKVGYAFAKKNETFNADGMQVAQGAPQYTVTTQNVPHGYKYVFDRWVGFYPDGKEVNSSKIEGNCDLFAYFKAEKKHYNVTFKNDYQQVWSVSLEYQTKLGEVGKIGDTQISFINDSYAHDPEGRGRDPYYSDFTFAGYEVTVRNEDGTVQSTTDYASYTDLNNIVIQNDTDIKVKYAETKKSFKVKASPVDEEGNPLAFDDSSAYEEVNVVYDEELALTKTIAGKHLDHYEGTYGTSESVPESLRGKKVDSKFIRYEADLKAVFAPNKKSVAVNFHEKPSSEAVTFEEGDTLVYPSSVKAADGYSFTGLYSASPTGFEVFDESHLFDSETLDLYPICVPSKICHNVDKKYFYYRFDKDLQGYFLENFAYGSFAGDTFTPEKVAINLAKADYWGEAASFSDDLATPYDNYAGLVVKYGVVGISSFKSSSGTKAKASSAANIATVEIPDSVISISSSGLAGLSSLLKEDGTAVLDLSQTSIINLGDYAFKGDVNIKKIILPDGLYSAGSQLFYDCDYLSEAMIKEGLSTTNFADDWNKNGEITVTVTPY